MQEIDFKKFVELVRSRNSIVDVISQSVRLDRRGLNYWGSCPFHIDKTPSFSVNEDKSSYYCFSCKRSGDVFQFLMEMDNLTFMEALERLAGRVGMEVPEFSQLGKNGVNKEKYDRYYDILTESAKFYNNCLKKDIGANCRDYISARGLTSSTVTNFGIGYSPNYDSLPEYLIGKGYTQDEIIATGVCLKNNSNKLYDFEGGRLIIPIMNKSGKVIAFGGRLIVDKKNAGKYLNTKETVLFKKSSEIFGYINLKKLKQTGRLTSLIIVEGYMDVISLCQAGFNNTCASMGTAFTAEHCKILEFFSNNIYLCYDGDNAGQTAIAKAIDVLANYDYNLKIIMLPNGLDPDDVIKKFGNDYFKTLIDKAVSPIEFKLRRLLKIYDIKDSASKAKAIRAAIDLLKDLPSMVEREIYLPLISSIFNIGADVIRKDLDNLVIINSDNLSGSSNNVNTDNDKRKVRNPKYEKYLVSARYVLFALFKGYLKIADKSDDLSIFFIDDEHKNLFNIVRCHHDSNALTIALIYDENGKESKLIAELPEYKAQRGESPTRYYEDCLINLKEQYYDVMFNDLNQEYREENDPIRKQEILLLLNQVAKAKRELKK